MAVVQARYSRATEKDARMADPPAHPDTGDDIGVTHQHGSPPGAPRWVKVSLILVAVLVLGFVLLKIAGVGGGHGPGRHLPGGDAPAGQMHPR